MLSSRSTSSIISDGGRSGGSSSSSISCLYFFTCEYLDKSAHSYF